MGMGKVMYVGVLMVLHVAAASAQSAQSANSTVPLADQQAPAVSTGHLLAVAAAPRLVLAAPAGQVSSSPAYVGLPGNVAEFRAASRREGGRGALIGVAVGGLLGAAFGAARCDRGIDSCASAFYLGAAAGMLPGAGVGALIGHQFTRGALAHERGGEAARRQ